MENNFINSVEKEFLNYKILAEKTFEQLSDEQLFWQYNAESNSVAAIVKHLSGNMRSRWTDFMRSDGEKPWRNRDQEFEIESSSRQDMLSQWESGWACLFTALHGIQEDQLVQTIFIRQEQHTVMEAIHRQLAHYLSHIGQIVFIGKMLKGTQWQNLSIPKGQSAAFNKAMHDKQQQPKERD